MAGSSDYLIEANSGTLPINLIAPALSGDSSYRPTFENLSSATLLLLHRGVDGSSCGETR